MGDHNRHRIPRTSFLTFNMVSFAAAKTSFSGLVRAAPSAGATRGFSVASRAQAKYSLPSLPYAYNALEPAISEQIMTTHHSKHHQTYVNGLNAAEENYGKAVNEGDVAKQIALQSALKFNGGGHINHSLFWRNLAPAGSAETKLSNGSLERAINSTFGSFDEFKAKFNATAASIQGSGWCWLGANEDGSLKIETTKDQDPLVSCTPIVGVDCWEHAYYLQYLNVKADYFKNIWSVINWTEAQGRFEAATK